MPRTAQLVGGVLCALAVPISAHPTVPEPVAVVAQDNWPLITPAPIVERGKAYRHERRDVISKIETFASGAISDVKSLGSAAASFVTADLTKELQFLSGFPEGSGVVSSLGLDDDQLDALPTEVLNIPNYGNWTDKGWNLRFRANVYKQPNTTQEKLDDLANIFLIDVDIKDLPADQQKQARNLTAEIFVVQQGDRNVTFDLSPAPSQGSSGEPGGGGAATPKGGNQTIKFPYETTDQGDIDDFVLLNDDGLDAGNETSSVQRLNVFAEGSKIGNATSFLVPPKGLTIISDIDDILRVTKIWNPKEGLLNSFARPFTPWMNMPSIYANWSRSLDDVAFHYLTTTPEQVTRNYMDFIYKTYPGGSFDTRPLNFSDASATLSIREYLLTRIFETFPQRKFILVADVSNSDVMKDYPKMATDFPNQVQCILLRNTTATDDSMYFPYNTEGFKNLNTESYFFFNVPDDLKNLDVSNGHCVNSSVQQHVTFGYQNLPLGLDDEKEDAASMVRSQFNIMIMVVMGVVSWVMI